MPISPGEKMSMAKESKEIQKAEAKATPISGGALESCVEIDATEFAQARRDPAVRDLLERADQYAESLRLQGRLG
jgi:hypothetical protein